MKSSQALNAIYSTTALIESRTARGGGFGTGFFFKLTLGPSGHCPILVTNKHVVDGAQSLRFRVSVCDPSNFAVQTGIAIWEVAGGIDHIIIKHPTLDLAAISLANLLEELNRSGAAGHGSFLAEHDIVIEEELESSPVAAPVLMVGYPTGLSDKKHNLPLIRRGALASDPRIPFNGEDCFVIDCACWPGSSGSPILLETDPYRRLPESRLTRRTGNALVGILYEGPTHMADVYVSMGSTPAAAPSNIKTQTMINLGYVIPAQRILDFKEMIPEDSKGKEIAFRLIQTGK